MDNLLQYGFQPYKWRHGPTYRTKLIASAASFDVSGGAQNVGLWPGDVVITAGDQSLALCTGSENSQTPVSPQYVVIATGFQWDATVGKMMLKHSHADAVTYSLAQRAGRVFVAAVEDAIWSVVVDDITTATTEADYQELVDLNVDMINAGATGELKANPKLDISSAATTATLKWRIVGIDPTKDNRDFSGANVRLLVVPNVYGSTTGVA
jgi:hypothetical protein